MSKSSYNNNSYKNQLNNSIKWILFFVFIAVISWVLHNITYIIIGISLVFIIVLLSLYFSLIQKRVWKIITIVVIIFLILIDVLLFLDKSYFDAHFLNWIITYWKDLLYNLWNSWFSILDNIKWTPAELSEKR